MLTVNHEGCSSSKHGLNSYLQSLPCTLSSRVQVKVDQGEEGILVRARPKTEDLLPSIQEMLGRLLINQQCQALSPSTQQQQNQAGDEDDHDMMMIMVMMHSDCHHCSRF